MGTMVSCFLSKDPLRGCYTLREGCSAEYVIPDAVPKRAPSQVEPKTKKKNKKKRRSSAKAERPVPKRKRTQQETSEGEWA